MREPHQIDHDGLLDRTIRLRKPTSGEDMKQPASTDSRKNTPVHSLAPPDSLEREAAELCPLGLLVSEDRHIIWCNHRFAEHFGFARDQLLGRSLEGLYPSRGEFQRIGDRGLRVMLESGEYQDERLMRRHDGTLRWFRVHGRAVDREHPFASAVWTFEPLHSGVDASRLTPREREVLAAIARGMTAKECAKELGISPRTVEKLRDSLRVKYGAHNAAELMRRVSGLPEGESRQDRR
jgi:PAS domain S-box-containing protein